MNLRHAAVLAALLGAGAPARAQNVVAGGAVSRPVQMGPILVREIQGMIGRADFGYDRLQSASAKLDALTVFSAPVADEPRAAARAAAANLVLGLLSRPEEIARRKEALTSSLGSRPVRILEEQARLLHDEGRSSRTKVKLAVLRSRFDASDIDVDAVSRRLASLYDGWTETWSAPNEVTIPHKYRPGLVQRYSLKKADGRPQKTRTYLVTPDSRNWIEESPRLVDPLKADANALDDAQHRLGRRLGPRAKEIQRLSFGESRGGHALSLPQALSRLDEKTKGSVLKSRAAALLGAAAASGAVLLAFGPHAPFALAAGGLMLGATLLGISSAYRKIGRLAATTADFLRLEGLRSRGGL